ncbi:unnamed protein product [Macrosiphum euphorbiae]|uniref:SWIM-type domain-containing protein n=1 Tax=Macrosiphum euphorbiae TaxID=13131 RepID=A0AAV0VV30_9HEMI|nr:unnamed protein product [Macrosiphum euphorbiae]
MRGRSKNTQYKFVKDGLPAIIKINNDHNHNIRSAEALSFLKPSEECRPQFENYFNDGLGISESIKMHESKLELEYGINSNELANATINPKYRTIRHWYDVWKENNLGSSNDISVLQKLEEKKKYYEENGIIVRYSENPFAILVITSIMKRAHQLPFAKDIAFVDSTSSCDIQSHSVTFMLAPCGVRAVPLGIFITKGQSTVDYKAAFTLLKQSMPNGFNAQWFPKQFVIDDSEAEKQALQSIWPEWCLVFRDASVHGHQTNNFSEVNVRIFKDIVLSRNKAYNAVALVDFICTSLEEYYLRRLRTFVNGRNDTARHVFEDQLKRAVSIKKDSIKKLSENIYRVQSETENTFYEVDVTNGFCPCPKGKLGAFCKHQAAICHHHEMNVPSLPAINTESRYLLAKLAFCEHVREKSFYIPLTSESNIINNNTALKEGVDLNDHENNSAHDYL